MRSDEQKRGPGRPRKDELPQRRKREIAGVTGKRLGVNEDLLDFGTFRYRYINETPGRLEALTQRDDWTIMTQDGGEIKSDASDLGAAVSVVVGTNPDGSPMRAYLARKLRAFWDEDQRQKQNDLDEQLAQLKRGLSREGASQADYVPTSGISIT